MCRDDLMTVVGQRTCMCEKALTETPVSQKLELLNAETRHNERNEDMQLAQGLEGIMHKFLGLEERPVSAQQGSVGKRDAITNG